MRTIFLSLMVLTLFTCNKEKEETPEFVNTISLIQPVDDFIFPDSRMIEWEQLEAERNVIQIFKDVSMSIDSRIYGDELSIIEETILEFPEELQPEKEYWIKITNSTATLERKLTIQSGIDTYVGTHDVNISISDGSVSSYSGVLTITKIDENRIRITEPTTSLDHELTYVDAADVSFSIWFNRTDPDINIQLRSTDGLLRALYYLEELNIGAYWEYVNQ